MVKWSEEKSMLERRRIVVERVTKTIGHLTKEEIITVCLGNMSIEKAESFADFQEAGNVYTSEETGARINEESKNT
jgi:hypothetical protein